MKSIKLTHTNGTIALNPSNIVKLVEAGSSSKWHGINTYVHLMNSDVIEARETITEIESILNSNDRQQLIDALLSADWSGTSIDNRYLIRAAIEELSK